MTVEWVIQYIKQHFRISFRMLLKRTCIWTLLCRWLHFESFCTRKCYKVNNNKCKTKQNKTKPNLIEVEMSWNVKVNAQRIRNLIQFHHIYIIIACYKYAYRLTLLYLFFLVFEFCFFFFLSSCLSLGCWLSHSTNISIFSGLYISLA